jgi:uncharacterized hydrophobic protein (TIGR00271 family)
MANNNEEKTNSENPSNENLQEQKSTSEKAEAIADAVVEKVVPEEHKEKIKTSFRDLLESLKHYLNIKEGIDIPGTIESIKNDVEFKGYNLYILVFSIFIASIGLNVNSTAVIIGAMLISPLMGPIVGVGLAVGINDIKLLTKSLKNLGITVLFSVATSMIYFWISPIHEDSHELLARTTPTILDALVAIFGGLAGIMASSRKAKTNAVPGVAIATALMPPLCTAGYGLASLNFNYFFGAFYLFLLNSIFISLSTIVVVRYVGFPRVDFINPEREKRVKRYIYSFIIIVLIPSGFIFWNVIQESLFKQKATEFIKAHVDNEHTSVVNSVLNYDSEGGSIKLFVMGEHLSPKDIDQLNHEMVVAGLENTQLIIRQNKDISGDLKEDISGTLREQVKSGILEEMFTKNREELAAKTEEIEALEEKLKTLYGDSVPGYVLRKEVKVIYPEIESNYFATIEHGLDGKSDTIPTVFVRWKEGTRSKVTDEQSEKLSQWLAVRLNMDTVRVLKY